MVFGICYLSSIVSGTARCAMHAVALHCPFNTSLKLCCVLILKHNASSSSRGDACQGANFQLNASPHGNLKVYTSFQVGHLQRVLVP